MLGFHGKVYPAVVPKPQELLYVERLNKNLKRQRLFVSENWRKLQDVIMPLDCGQKFGKSWLTQEIAKSWAPKKS